MNKRIYKDILDNIYDGVYFVDCERRIAYWNHGAGNITGYTSDARANKPAAIVSPATLKGGSNV